MMGPWYFMITLNFSRLACGLGSSSSLIPMDLWTWPSLRIWCCIHRRLGCRLGQMGFCSQARGLPFSGLHQTYAEATAIVILPLPG